ncbi:MAG: hypothetical protein LBB88_07445 [Planctomycetaceae bacterium]|nr:hypothetical protein [Planctomycetaceae bacterium]
MACVAFSDPVHYPVNRYSAIIRIAPILFLLWLAWRDLTRIPFWVYIVSFPVLMICLIKPMLFLYVIPIIFVTIFGLTNRQNKKK